MDVDIVSSPIVIWGSSLENSLELANLMEENVKTIYSRLTTMTPAIDALASVGVHVKDASGDMKSVSDILTELSVKWKHLSAEQQQNLGVTLAGRFFIEAVQLGN